MCGWINNVAGFPSETASLTVDVSLAPTATDWPQIVAQYELLMRISDNPVVALNHAVAVAMAQGPKRGLEPGRPPGGRANRPGPPAPRRARAHLLEMAGDRVGARDSYLEAARRATNLRRQRYLHARAARLG